MQALLYSAALNAQLLSKGQSLLDGDRVLVSDNPGVIPETIEALLNCHSTDEYLLEINDIEAYIRSYVYTYQDGSRLRLKAYNPIQEARQNKLSEFTQKAGLTPAQVSDNFKQNKLIHNHSKLDLKPQALANKLLSRTYSEEIQVISNACNLMQAELVSYPDFRAIIRAEYKNHVKIYTSPTEKGKTVLDVFHPYYRVKNLAGGKSVGTFNPELWAEALKCESLELIKIEFKLPWDDIKEDKIFNQVKSFYVTQNNEGIEGE